VDASTPLGFYNFTVIHTVITPESSLGAVVLVEHKGDSFHILGQKRDDIVSRFEPGKWKCSFSIELNGQRRFQNLCFNWSKGGLSVPESVQ
jgi:hypothetical protein